MQGEEDAGKQGQIMGSPAKDSPYYQYQAAPFSPSQAEMAGAAPFYPEPICNPCGCCCCPGCNLRTNCIAIGVIWMILGPVGLLDILNIKDINDCRGYTADLKQSDCTSCTRGWLGMLYIDTLVYFLPGLVLLITAAARKETIGFAATGLFLIGAIYELIFHIYVFTCCELAQAVGQAGQSDNPDTEIQKCKVRHSIQAIAFAAWFLYFAFCARQLSRQIKAGVDRLPHTHGAQVGVGDQQPFEQQGGPPPPPYTQSPYNQQYQYPQYSAQQGPNPSPYYSPQAPQPIAPAYYNNAPPPPAQ